MRPRSTVSLHLVELPLMARSRQAVPDPWGAAVEAIEDQLSREVSRVELAALLVSGSSSSCGCPRP